MLTGTTVQFIKIQQIIVCNINKIFPRNNKCTTRTFNILQRKTIKCKTTTIKPRSLSVSHYPLPLSLHARLPLSLPLPIILKYPPLPFSPPLLHCVPSLYFSPPLPLLLLFSLSLSLPYHPYVLPSHSLSLPVLPQIPSSVLFSSLVLSTSISPSDRLLCPTIPSSPPPYPLALKPPSASNPAMLLRGSNVPIPF